MDANARLTLITPAAAMPSGQGGFADSRASEEAARAARYRLVIERGDEFGTFVYKTLDRTTGEVVKQFPRDAVVEMAKNPGYGAGTVIDTQA